MTKRKKPRKPLRPQLDRIERKCDRMLAEILIMRQRGREPLDDILDRLHRSARIMGLMCEREYEDAVSRLNQGR